MWGFMERNYDASRYYAIFVTSLTAGQPLYLSRMKAASETKTFAARVSRALNHATEALSAKRVQAKLEPHNPAECSRGLATTSLSLSSPICTVECVLMMKTTTTISSTRIYRSHQQYQNLQRGKDSPLTCISGLNTAISRTKFIIFACDSTDFSESPKRRAYKKWVKLRQTKSLTLCRGSAACFSTTAVFAFSSTTVAALVALAVILKPGIRYF